ncbi:hypothetical protein [Chitinophaga eiseniae]|uniref:Uncharacterized protein n=1 Tax=Chitinophaga eiseniae TaxID=634771 RepID=A0A847SW99_9BACT|nr:hypothetical protein [Chitinophaga eiseniae]NLR82439.1 hypothetical protein [Chitinophaga eiseniae]
MLPPDILVIPGAPLETIDSLMSNSAFMGWSKQLTDRAGVMMSVCTKNFSGELLT